jgi:hypothetical protein
VTYLPRALVDAARVADIEAKLDHDFRKYVILRVGNLRATKQPMSTT